MQELSEIECGQIIRIAWDSIRETQSGLSHFPGALKKIIKYKAWRRVHLLSERGDPMGRVVELKSLRELITGKDMGCWNEDPKKIEALLKGDPEALVMFREEMKGQEGGDKRSKKATTDDNVISGRSQVGNSRAYGITRVQKECDEETVAEVMAGRISPHKALIKSGVKQNRQIYASKNPAEFAAKIREQFGEEYAESLGEHLASLIVNNI